MRHLNTHSPEGTEFAHPIDMTDPDHVAKLKRQRAACPKCGAAIVRTRPTRKELHEEHDGHAYVFIPFEGEWMCQRALDAALQPGETT